MLRMFRTFLIGAFQLGIVSAALPAGEHPGNRILIRTDPTVQPSVFYHRPGNASVREVAAGGSELAKSGRSMYPDVSVPAYGPLPIWRPGTQPAAKLQRVRRAALAFGPVRGRPFAQQVVTVSHRPRQTVSPKAVDALGPRSSGIAAPEPSPRSKP